MTHAKEQQDVLEELYYGIFVSTSKRQIMLSNEAGKLGLGLVRKTQIPTYLSTMVGHLGFILWE